MKPANVHVIKSVRIAKARMIMPLHDPEPKSVSRSRRNSRSGSRKRDRSADHLLGRKENSHSTTCSGSQIETVKRGRGSFNFKVPRADAEIAAGPGLAGRPVLTPSGRTFEFGGSKRLKSRKWPTIIEDGLPWTEEEMENFENMFGEQLFDNTIDTGPSFQADLGILATRRFRRYAESAAGVTGLKGRSDMAQIFDRARKLLEQHGNLCVSNSQLLRLLSFFSSEKGFFDFLNLEGEVLINYFEKTKLYPRRKVYK